MKVLNLDKLSTKGSRKLRLAGVDYDVLPMTVGNFVETTLAAERMVDEGNVSMAAELKEAVAMIRRSVPDAPENALNELELEQIRVIVAFIKGDDVGEVAEDADAKN